MGESAPDGWSDLKKGLEKAIQSRLIYLDKKSSGHVSDVAKQIWELADGNIEKIISLFDNAIKGRKGERYLLGGAGKTNNGNGFRRSNQSAFQPNKPREISTIQNNPEISPIADPGTWDKFYRSECEHWTWKDSRHWPAKLWTELCHYFPRPWDRKIYIDGHGFILEGGKIVITERQLATRYGTTKTQVHTLLVKLEIDGMITRESVAKWKKSIGKQQPDDGPDDGPSAGPSKQPGKQPGKQPREFAPITVINICNYWNYHTKIESPQRGLQPSKQPGKQPGKQSDDGPSAGPSAGPHIIEDRIKEEENTTPVVPSIQLTAQLMYEIWESNRGSLSTVRIREPEKLAPLIAYFNSLAGDPMDHLKDFIDRMRRVDSTHRAKMKLVIFSQNMPWVDRLLDGDFDKPWGVKNGRATVAERKGKGDASEFGGTGEAGEERVKRLIKDFPGAPAVSKV